ncbi:PAS domain S-box-containing protein [Dyadobacter jejuensis]|uniref:histidine kinase n=1 Tax=Dyadobacter jejuensis TaxID=1082580 RepID=A0A316AEI8_9BACT|nr:PAS domain S-box protein [Dyadobacter jejuensis]PWJ55304.1 PAS domain S-box-containing protein [Dyadobacter jejuensis]
MKSLPIPENEYERLKALRNYRIVDTHAEKEFDRLTELASIICEVPVSLVTLIDKDRQWIKSSYNMEIEETSRETSFCQYTILDDGLMEVEDTTLDDRFKDNPFVTANDGVRYYAGYPLVSPEGYAIGSFCVIDTKPHRLSDVQHKALKLLSIQAMDLIIDHKKREELRHFEHLFRLSNDMICLTGANGYFRQINPAFERILGWKQAYLLKTSLYELIHPEDVGHTYQSLTQLLHRKEDPNSSPANFVHRFRNSSGKYRYIQWTASYEPVSGNLFAIGRDITEERLKENKLRMSEERFRSFFENSQGFMCTHDLYGKILSVNRAGAELLGYRPEEVLKMTLYDLIPSRHHSAIHSYMEQIRQTGKANGFMTTKHKDGSHRVWNYHNILLKNADDIDYVVGNSVDVTESQVMAKKLQVMQQQLIQTGKMARVGGWEVDLIRNKILWSDMTREIHEVGPDFIPSMEDGISFYKEGPDRETILSLVQKAMEEGSSFDVELQLVTAQKKEIWVRSLGFAEMENGICKRLYGTFQDIDAKKRTELEIINSRKFLNDLLNASSEVSIIATDTQGLITVFNRGAEKLLGYRAEEVVGIHTPELIHLEQEVQDYAAALSEKAGEAIQGFRTFTYNAEINGSDQREWTYLTKNKETIPVMLVVTSIRDYQQNIIGYLGLATDLSARKKAEAALISEKARLSAFVRNAPAAVAMFDLDLKYLAVSRRWLEEYKIEDRLVIGKSHYDIFPNLSQKWKDIHQRALKGEVVKNDEDRWRPEGWDHDQYLNWEIHPWYLPNQTVGGLMMFTQDITEAALQKEELQLAKKQSEQASIAKSEFLANMSHEIRTPLNGVIGFTDLVLKTKMSEVQRQYLTIVNQSANSLLGIINDILDFSKIEAGKLELDIAKSDIYDITGDSADIISYPIQSKGLELLLNIPNNLPRFVWVDEIRIKQVLINLLSNAAKFTPSGEIELKIEILDYDPSLSDALSCRFSVRDTGIGIKEEKQAKIFEAFLQEDSSTTKKYGGTGLGLAISNQLLKMMGSKLQLISKQGVGSTFYFDLTLQSEPGEPIQWEHYDILKRVLIVDDNHNNRMILKQMLELLNIESVEAVNGHDAIHLLSGDLHFSAILMDYHMPEIDGLQTIAKIRRELGLNADQLPIVLLSSSAEDATVLKSCEALDVNYRLMKPIKIDLLTQCLSRLTKKETQSLTFGDPQLRPSRVESLTILLAEDNEVNMFLAKTVIKKLMPNCHILEAINGLEAVAHCEKGLPDIIFMDVQMPKMNGYEATRAIRQLPGAEGISIVALTAANVKGERDKSLEVGMNDFISKPFVEQDIWSLLNRLPQTKELLEVESIEPIKEMTNTTIIDVDKLREYYMNDEEFIKEFLVLAQDALLKAQEELLLHHQKADLDQIKAVGHRLKGAASAAFLYRVTDISKQLESLMNYDEKTVGSLLSELDQEIAIILPLIQNWQS